MALCPDHLLQISVSLFCLLCTAGNDLCSSSCTLMGPAFAPMGVAPAFKNGELPKLGTKTIRTKAKNSRREKVGNSEGMSFGGGGRSRISSVASLWTTSTLLRNRTRRLGRLVRLTRASTIASSPFRPSSKNADARRRGFCSIWEESIESPPNTPVAEALWSFKGSTLALYCGL